MTSTTAVPDARVLARRHALHGITETAFAEDATSQHVAALRDSLHV